MKRLLIVRNIFGAFSDGAVLFPLLALLSLKAGYSGSILLFSTGIMYLISSIYFGIPMAVQPLKSIAVAALTVGASFEEVRLSGILLGLFCLMISLINVDRFAKRVPAAVIHQLQVGLGVLLVLQGVKSFGDWTLLVSSISGLGVLGVALSLVLFPEVGGLPLLGLIATFGLIAALFVGDQSLPSVKIFNDSPLFRPQLVAGLLIPQLVLTLSNSVLATRDVCNRYYGELASKVTLRRLLYSIGLGNLFVGLIGGMPFCHGSGGVTAHARGGSTHAWSTALMGIFLLILALFQVIQNSSVLSYPPFLVAILLMATGIFHLKLASPTANCAMGWFKLLIAFVVTIITKNLLWVLGFAVAIEALEANLHTEVKKYDLL